MATSFEYNIQNISLFLFLMLIGTIGSYSPERLQNLNTKGKTKLIVVVQVCYLKCVSVEEPSADCCSEEI